MRICSCFYRVVILCGLYFRKTQGGQLLQRDLKLDLDSTLVSCLHYPILPVPLQLLYVR